MSDEDSEGFDGIILKSAVTVLHYNHKFISILNDEMKNEEEVEFFKCQPVFFHIFFIFFFVLCRRTENAHHTQLMRLVGASLFSRLVNQSLCADYSDEI